ncbi:MAG: tol-pal system YbgF family protein [Candidatus Limisoma sp.]
MKSTNYILPIISSLAAMLIASPAAEACGPYFPCIPTPDFFISPAIDSSVVEFERNENLRLWQQLTSPAIPTDDIAEVLYSDNCRPGNLFRTFLRNTKDYEVEQFLSTAKELEKQRREVESPWYYPEHRYNANGEFDDIIKTCKAYRGTRLKDRYALQLVRALFAARKYAECVESYDEYFRDFPDSNLLKRMAMKYVAGCWARLGDTRKANRFFIHAGDFGSIINPDSDAVADMADYNPDNAELMSYIQYCSDDSARFCAVKPVAEKVLRGKKVRNRGDWEFYLAYEAGEFHSDYATAERHMARALRSQFSSVEFRENARTYRMKVDGALGRRGNLLADLRWIESKIDILSPTAEGWNRVLQNIIYTSWVPTLWRQKDYATAILLCSYADNFLDSKQLHTGFPPSSFFDSMRYFCSETLFVSVPLNEIRKSTKMLNPLDYCNASFRLMNSLESTQLIAAKRAFAADTPLYRHLKRYARVDAPYIDELIGTLALREGLYSRAADYLARVPDKYLATVNVYKNGNLRRNPFCAFPGYWHDFDTIGSPMRAKYNFARKMVDYENRMRRGKTPDERGLARLKYAIGRYNSLVECWGLTQYWRGCVTTLFMPSFDEYGEDIMRGFPELFDENDRQAAEQIFDKEVRAARAMLTGDAARAEAEYMLSNLKIIKRRYPDTPTAQMVKTSCDRWRLWF